MSETLDALVADPRATLRAIDCVDARESFLTFCGMVEIPSAPVDEEDEEEDAERIRYRPPSPPTAAHHVELCGVLQAIDEGRVKRAMFFLPPGAAKSTYGSVLFPAWFLGRKKRRNVGVATYASDLSRKLGRRMRAVVRQPVYREIFGTGVSAEQGAANEWALETGNEFMGHGILAGWTGNRLDGLVIDDPIKGRREADSETVRASTLAAYQDDLLTRLKPNGWVLLIQTRWHEEDLAGSILPEDYDGETGWVLCRDEQWWYVVCIPAQAERADDPLGRKIGQYICRSGLDGKARPIRARSTSRRSGRSRAHGRPCFSSARGLGKGRSSRRLGSGDTCPTSFPRTSTSTSPATTRPAVARRTTSPAFGCGASTRRATSGCSTASGIKRPWT